MRDRHTLTYRERSRDNNGPTFYWKIRVHTHTYTHTRESRISAESRLRQKVYAQIQYTYTSSGKYNTNIHTQPFQRVFANRYDVFCCCCCCWCPFECVHVSGCYSYYGIFACKVKGKTPPQKKNNNQKNRIMCYWHSQHSQFKNHHYFINLYTHVLTHGSNADQYFCFFASFSKYYFLLIYIFFCFYYFRFLFFVDYV